MEKLKKPERQIVLLVGLPGVGKSHYIDNHKEEFKNFVILSVDKIAEDICDKVRKTTGKRISTDYVFINKLEEVWRIWDKQFNDAVNRGSNIVIDGSSKTLIDRAEHLNIVKKSEHYDYKSTAMVINPPSEDEHIARIVKRAIHNKRFVSATKLNVWKMQPIQEGEFDHVEYVGTSSDKPLFHEYGKPSANIFSTIKLVENDAINLGNGRQK